MSGIRLHPEHGMNPTIPICFFCRKEKNEVALLGAAYKGQAPMHMLIDYHPCDTCKAKMDQGVTLIEASEHPIDTRPPMGPNVYPTGTWAVVTEESCHRLFTPKKILDQVLKHRKAFIEVGIFQKMGVFDNEKRESPSQEVPTEH